MSTTIRESRNVFSENPVVFLLDLEEAIKDGFRVENTIPGYPSLNSILKEVRVFRQETAALEQPSKYFEKVEVRIANYDPMQFLLDVQFAILEGFEIDRQRVSFDPHGLKSCTLVRSEVSVDLAEDAEAEEPAKPAKTRKPRKPKGETA